MAIRRLAKNQFEIGTPPVFKVQARHSRPIIIDLGNYLGLAVLKSLECVYLSTEMAEVIEIQRLQPVDKASTERLQVSTG